MMKTTSSFLLFAMFLYSPSDRFAQYKPLISYETKTGIQITPTYSENGSVCEISMERRAYHDDQVNVKPSIAAEEALSLFDQLVPRAERGEPGWKLPEGTTFTEVDGGTRATHVMYQNVSLVMYGDVHNEKYAVAVITWKNIPCKKA